MTQQKQDKIRGEVVAILMRSFEKSAESASIVAPPEFDAILDKCLNKEQTIVAYNNAFKAAQLYGTGFVYTEG